MQEPHIKLKEIIWEITDKCHNKCSYCGSKDILNKIKPSNEDIKKIALTISEYPPEEINISGGDPLLVDFEVHKYITEIFKSKGIVCKILVNPHSFDAIRDDILDLYDWIGISINTNKELRLLNDLWAFALPNNIKTKCTIITNFNITNLFEYYNFENFVKDNNLNWQIQYTMYQDSDINAIYTNNDAKDVLFKYIEKSLNNNIKVICADNMNSGKCSAGMQSLGILCNGDVISCLSMRSWDKRSIEEPIGNLLHDDLIYLWEAGFSRFRCSSFECCKDICKAPFTTKSKTKQIYRFPDEPINPFPNISILYGVQAEPRRNDNIFVYGVTHDPYPIAMAYGVYTGDWGGVSTNNYPPGTSMVSPHSGFKSFSRSLNPINND